MFADSIYMNGVICTVNEAFDLCEAVAVKDGKIIAVGTEDEIMKLKGDDTEIIDLGGAFMLPGLHDAHLHPSDYVHNLHHLALDHFETIPEVLAALKEYRKTVTSGWVLCNGLTQDVADAGITRHDLDTVVSDVPVVMVMWHGHGCLANSAALAAADITKDTPDPAGGIIEREADGSPNGFLQEASALQLVFRGMESFTSDQIAERLIEMQHIMNSMGYTAFTESTAGTGNNGREGGASGEKCVEAYVKVLERGEMTCRVSVGFYSGRNGIQSCEALKEDIEAGKIPVSKDKDWLDFHMTKFFCDGVEEAHTAWLLDDYADRPGWRGTSCFGAPDATEEERIAEIRRTFELAHKSGYQIGVHCIGGRAVKEAIDAIIAAQEKYPRANCRHCIIHGDIYSDTADVIRGSKYGIMISSQPVFSGNFGHMASLVGRRVAEKTFSMHELMNAGVVVAGGSDSIAGDYKDWRVNMYNALERKDIITGEYVRQDMACTVEEVIKMHTINGAYQEFAEDKRGSIEPGKFADFTVIDKNLLEIPHEEILNAKVLRTVVDGKTVYLQN